MRSHIDAHCHFYVGITPRKFSNVRTSASTRPRLMLAVGAALVIGSMAVGTAAAAAVPRPIRATAATGMTAKHPYRVADAAPTSELTASAAKAVLPDNEPAPPPLSAEDAAIIAEKDAEADELYAELMGNSLTSHGRGKSAKFCDPEVCRPNADRVVSGPKKQFPQDKNYFCGPSTLASSVKVRKVDISQGTAAKKLRTSPGADASFCSAVRHPSRTKTISSKSGLVLESSFPRSRYASNLDARK